MKKVYKKPMLVIENFMLSEHIAACSPQFANNIEFVENDLRFAGYFTDTADGCSRIISNGSSFIYNSTQVCYHTYVDNAIVFSS